MISKYDRKYLEELLFCFTQNTATCDDYKIFIKLVNSQISNFRHNFVQKISKYFAKNYYRLRKHIMKVCENDLTIIKAFDSKYIEKWKPEEILSKIGSLNYDEQNMV